MLGKGASQLLGTKLFLSPYLIDCYFIYETKHQATMRRIYVSLQFFDAFEFGQQKDVVCEFYVRVVNRRTIHDCSKYLFMHKIEEIKKKYTGPEIRSTVTAWVPRHFFSRRLYRYRCAYRRTSGDALINFN